MESAHDLLKVITVVLCVAAVVTVIFQRLRQPVVLGYILAGLVLGPHVPIPLIADHKTTQMLSELGVILLMFSLGLEFSLQKLMKVGLTAGMTAIIQSSLMVWAGFIVGRLFGWTLRESIFTGAIIAISSTTIIAKAFDEQGIKGKLRELVVGVLIVEDLIAILLMAILTALSSGDGLSAGTVIESSGRLLAFLVGLISMGMLLVPRAVRYVNRLKRPEITVIGSVGLCFAVALLAAELGYSVALGAFIAGSLIAESGEEKEIEHLILPVRDLFAAIFFVSVGMMLDPGIIVQHWAAVTVLTVVVIVGKFIGVSMGAFLAGNGTRTSVRAGMSLAQIGEFSFIIAALGISLHATRDFLYPVAIAVSAITTLTTPWLIRAANPVASLIDRKLPRSLQTFTALYGTWVEQLGERNQGKTTSRMNRLIKLLAFDTAILIALVIGAALSMNRFVEAVTAKLGVSLQVAFGLLGLTVLVLALPLLVGIFRITRAIGAFVSQSVLPPAIAGKVDLAESPRRALVVTLQLTVALVVGLPILALTQPFLPGWLAAITLASLLVILGFFFWRSAANLQGHVKAGAEMIVEALVAQARKRAKTDEETLEQIKQMMPGIGEPMPLRLDEGSAAVGKTLAQINLRGLTGASVLAILHGESGVTVPTASEVLRAGDVLALAGTKDSITAAIDVLKRGEFGAEASNAES